jgi:hypothetical protein
MQEGCEEQGGYDLPVKGATGAVGVDRPDHSIAIGIEEGTVLFKDLRQSALELQ